MSLKWLVNVAYTLVLAEFTDICVRREYLQTGKTKLTASSLYRSWFFLNALKTKSRGGCPLGSQGPSACGYGGGYEGTVTLKANYRDVNVITQHNIDEE